MSRNGDTRRWLRKVFGLTHEAPPDLRAARLRRLRIILTGLLGVSLLFTMYKLVYDGPRIGGIDNVTLFFLLNVNILLLVVIGIMVGRNVIKLILERGERRKAPFRTKLITAFLILTLVPTALLFVVASGLITNSIGNWSNITVERSMRDSMDLATDYYAQYQKRTSARTEELARWAQNQQMLLRANRAYLIGALPGKTAELGAAGGAVYDSGFTLRAQSAPASDPDLFPSTLEGVYADRLRGRELFTETRHTPHGAFVWSIAPVLDGGGGVAGAVISTEPINPWLLERIENISRTSDEYKQLQLQKLPINAMYQVTLAVVTLVVIFGSIWFGIYLAKDITGPIQQLVEATQKVAEGDLSVRVEQRTSDEIGILVSSFNRMTQDIADSRSRLESSHLEIDNRRRHIETILSTVAAGVISIDHRGHITTCNPSAVAILHLGTADPLGRYYEEMFSRPWLDSIRAMLREMARSRKETMKQELQLTVDGVTRTLLVNVSTLKDRGGAFMGMVVVFEDLTAIINAEKTAAWREIAQHIAHEIKNPLTPIKLNTERLRRNYAQDREAFERNFEPATRVIIHEVEVLRTLVDEFSRFGQLPVARLDVAPLHDTIAEVVQMFHGTRPEVPINTDFDPSIHEARIDREQMHRALRNLVENALAAIEGAGKVEIRTRRTADGKRIAIEVRDDGPGVDPTNLDKIFLPYFSTKGKKGTGLGLAIVNRIAADHEGTLTARNIEPHGLAVTMEIPAT